MRSQDALTTLCVCECERLAHDIISAMVIASLHRLVATARAGLGLASAQAVSLTNKFSIPLFPYKVARSVITLWTLPDESKARIFAKSNGRSVKAQVDMQIE